MLHCDVIDSSIPFISISSFLPSAHLHSFLCDFLVFSVSGGMVFCRFCSVILYPIYAFASSDCLLIRSPYPGAKTAWLLISPCIHSLRFSLLCSRASTAQNYFVCEGFPRVDLRLFLFSWSCIYYILHSIPSLASAFSSLHLSESCQSAHMFPIARRDIR